MKRDLILLAALLGALACDKPPLAPGLDQNTCDGAPCPPPGVIQGSLVYAGTARGDAILLLFDVRSLPPPDGNGTSAAAVARIPAPTLFGDAAPASIGPFSAPFVFTQVPSGRSYQVRAFLDTSGEFDPFFDFTQQPRAGAPAGGHGALVNGRPQLLPIQVDPGQVVSGVSVALTTTIPYDPPSFVLAGGSQVIDRSFDQPVRLRLQTAKLTALSASFDQAHFALELDLDAQGNPRSTAGDGLDDVFPRVFLRQLRTPEGTPVAAADAAIVPCRAIALPVLPALLQLAPGAAPLARDTLDVLVLPLAVKAADLSPLPAIPPGVYQTIVVEKTGQVWTLPNSLGDPARAGTPYYAASQAQTVTFDNHLTLPSGSISGNVVWSGGASKSGNILVQAYRDDPANPPPPLGGALPVRVRLIRAAQVAATLTGFSAPYQIDGLPDGKYVVEALDDMDGNFSGLTLLATPTKGDLVGAVLDPTLRPKSIAISAGAAVTGQDVTLGQQIPLDPPAFAVDPLTPALMPADQVTPVRFDLRAQPNAFPAGSAAAPHFTVQLVRNSGGAAVDSDHDGLADVWPRVFLVRLDPSDSTGLTQYVSPDQHKTVTQIIPAAVDPTPFLPGLQPQAGGNAPPVITDKVTVVVRPVLFDASTPFAAPQRLPSLQPGSYKIVLVEQTGQVWQIPNESGSAALDPSVVCAAGAATCAPGTVKTQSQSQSFQVGLPAHPIYTGAIAGTLTAATTPAAAYVLTYAASAPPPFGKPLSADVHLGSEFSGGSVSYTLPDLPAGNYLVMAVADTRGDFAASPALFALAPGAGTLLGSPVSVTVGSSPVTSVSLSAGSSAPPRPSFQVMDSAGTVQTGDLALSLAGTHAFKLAPAAVLTNGVAALKPDTAGAFVIACGATGPDSTSITAQLLKVRDAAGMVPELDAGGNPIVVPLTVDLSAFASCAPGLVTVTTPLPVSTPSAGVPSGRYQVMVTSLAKQVWRVPNELQPAAMDPAALAATPAGVKALLQTQQAAITLAP